MTVAANDPRICEGRSRWWWEGYDARMRAKPFAIQTTVSEWRAGWTVADLANTDPGVVEGLGCFLANVPDLKNRSALEEVKEWMTAKGIDYEANGWDLCLTRGAAGFVTVFALPTYALAFEFYSTFG